MTVDGLAVDGPATGRPSSEGPVQEATSADAPSGPFLTVAEVARRMRVSKMTVYRMVHGGELPAVRFGRTFRLQRRAVEELLAGARHRVG